MKKLFFMLVATISATMSFAQNTMVATLNHGDNISMYYGTNALRDAMNEAVSGDVINLSGGIFQPVIITKAVTIRGTGIDDANPTYIDNSLHIQIDTIDTNRFMMEGIICKLTIIGLSNAYFLKCLFSNTLSISGNTENITFANCKIKDAVGVNGKNTYTSKFIKFINCFIRNFESGEKSSTSFINCVISQYNFSNIKSSLLLNSIICVPTPAYSTTLPLSSIATNCLLVAKTVANSNNEKAKYEEVFKSYTGDYSDDETFELTDEAKKIFLGNDGTQIGMYGGLLPYTSIPSYPRITKMNVANKTTADGKLSVEIEVSAAE